MTLKLVIRCRLHSCPEFVPVNIESLASRAANNFVSVPRFDVELDEDHAFGVEEKENFVQPIHDLRGFVGSGCLEETFFKRFETRRVDENRGETL